MYKELLSLILSPKLLISQLIWNDDADTKKAGSSREDKLELEDDVSVLPDVCVAAFVPVTVVIPTFEPSASWSSLSWCMWKLAVKCVRHLDRLEAAALHDVPDVCVRAV